VSEAVLDPQAAEIEGKRLFRQGQYKEAAKQFSLAHQAYVEAAEKLKAAEMLNNVGLAYRRVGKHKEAVSALENARQVFSELGDQGREAQVLGNLGGLYSKMKRYDESAVCFQDSVDLFQALDDRARQSETLRAMAIMQFKRGQRATAFTTYEDALYYLPNPNFLQRFTRLLLKMRGLILRLSPFR
jgi:tetratricopeptide (TPR) repeat protein